MKIDRNLWRPNWQEGHFPPLPCPHCGAPLNIDDDSLVVKSPDHNIALVNLTDIDNALFLSFPSGSSAAIRNAARQSLSLAVAHINTLTTTTARRSPNAYFIPRPCTPVHP